MDLNLLGAAPPQQPPRTTSADDVKAMEDAQLRTISNVAQQRAWALEQASSTGSKLRRAIYGLGFCVLIAGALVGGYFGFQHLSKKGVFRKLRRRFR